MSREFVFSTLRLISEDIEKSINFISSVFNISFIERDDRFARFNLNNVNVELIAEDNKNPCSTGGAIGYWKVKDLDSILNKVKANGGIVYRGPLVVSENNTRIAQIKGPAGCMLGFEEV
ncbi:MAG: hypothetical protein CME62_13725 [Halobacteriovoraceae bacterium]|nr:hypothetical protein [Halobacteriovoraceae bacterium]